MGNDGYTSVFDMYTGVLSAKIKTPSGAIKYFDIDHTTECTRKCCTKLCRFTSRSLVYCAMKFHPVAVENRRKTRFFSTFFTAFREREVNLRIHNTPLLTWIGQQFAPLPLEITRRRNCETSLISSLPTELNRHYHPSNVGIIIRVMLPLPSGRCRY